MNTGLIPLVRGTLVVAAMAMALSGFSQYGKDGLTKDFSKLSAKERTRIAARENQEAAVDTSYQTMMHSAESAFQNRDYEKALAWYEEARKKRPYNVYPKVKIQDLDALLKKKREESAAQADAKTDTADTIPEMTVLTKTNIGQSTPTGVPSPALPIEPHEQAPAAVTPADKPRPAPKPVQEAKPEPQRSPSSVSAHTPVARRPQETYGPKSLGERVFLEGGAVVTERTVMDNDRATVYRRVVHPSGQVFTFKDGISIPGRMWDERFGE